MGFEKGQGLVIFLIFIFLFLGINVNPDIGYIYALMLLGFYIIIDDNKRITKSFFTNKRDFFNTIVIGVVAYGIFYVGTSVIISFLFPTETGLTVQGLTFDYIQAALSNSQFVENITFGILIPIVETIAFFGAIPQIYSYWAKVPFKLDLSNPSLLFMIIFISAAFTVFHITAKGVTNTKALMVSFLFGITSMILVLWRGQYGDAVVLHIVNNIHALDFF